MATGFTQQPTAINITDTSVTISATVETMTVPVWSTIPDITVDALDMPHQVNLTPYVTSQTPITAWGADIGTVVDGVWTVTTATTVGVHTVNVTADNQAGQGAGSFQLTVTVSEYLHNFDTAADGGFTHERASDAATTDYVGTIVTVTDDVEAYPGGKLNGSWTDEDVGYGIQLEETRTNLVRSSEDMTSSWNDRGTPSIISSTLPDPAGGLTGVHLQVDAKLTQDIFENNTVDSTPSSSRAVSVWMHRISTTGTIRISNSNTGDAGGRWDIDLSLLSEAWERVTEDHAAVTVINPMVGDASTGRCGFHYYSTTGAHQFAVWGHQQEDAAFPSSYIPTSGTPVIRAATNLSAPFSALSPLPDAGVVSDFSGQFITRIPDYYVSGAGNKSFYTLRPVGSGANYVSIRWLNDGRVQFRARVNSVNDVINVVYAGPITAGEVLDIRFVVRSSGNSTVSINGSVDTSATAVTFLEQLDQVLLQENPSHEPTTQRASHYPLVTRIVPAALSDEEITAWEGWTEPRVIIAVEPQDYDFGSPLPPGIPEITEQPEDVVTLEGSTANYSVVASGTPPLTYAWNSDLSGDWRSVLVDFPTASGADTPDLAIPNVQGSDGCNVLCRVSNTEGSRDSDPASMTVRPVDLPSNFALLFSDLPDAVNQGWSSTAMSKGAAVTIWGSGFGATQGSSVLKVGDTVVTDIVEWGVVGQPIPWLQHITFHLDDSMPVGNSPITLTVDGFVSAPLPFWVRDTGAIYFIDSSQGANGDGSLESPWNTTDEYFRNGNITRYAAPGDAIYLRSAANHPEGVSLYGGRSLPGEQNNSCALLSYPGETAAIDRSAEHPSEVFAIVDSKSHWTFSRLRLHGPACAIRFNTKAHEARYVRIVGNDCSGITVRSGGKGIIVPAGPVCGPHYVYGNTTHGCTTDNNLDHAIYSSGSNDGPAPTEIAYNYSYNNLFREGSAMSLNNSTDTDGEWRVPAGRKQGPIHWYNNWIDTRNTDPTSYDNASRGFYMWGNGDHREGEEKADPVYVYNNVVIGSTERKPGATDGKITPYECGNHMDVEFWNNLAYGFNDGGAFRLAKSTGTNPGNPRMIMKGNIVLGDGPTNADKPYVTTGYSGIGSPTIEGEYNIYHGGTAGSWDTGAVYQNEVAPLEEDPLVTIDTVGLTVTVDNLSPANGHSIFSQLALQTRDFNLKPYTDRYDSGPVLAEDE